MMEISEQSYSLIALNKILEKAPDELIHGAKLIQHKVTKECRLFVMNDIQDSTLYFDLRKKLRVQKYIYETEYVSRQQMEKLSHIFQKSEVIEASESDKQNKILNIIKTAVEMGASDLHIEIGTFTRFLFRIDGERVPMPQFEDSAEEGKVLMQSLYNSMCDERSAGTFSYQEPTQGKIREEYVKPYGLSTGRLASRPGSSGGVIVVIRLISRRMQSHTLQGLGLQPEEEKIIRRALAKPAGVIFSSGPTGHGKSTLSQAMAEIYAAENPGMNLISVEDPIESPMEGVFQTPLIITERHDSQKMGQAWAKAISNLMRLDPDGIYVGEVRDKTSGNGIIEAAQTGHLAISTIHTNYAIDILQRLRRWGVDQDLLTDATLITCLIGLRLVKKLCPSCKLSYSENRHMVDELFRDVIEQYTKTDGVFLKNPSGCKECNCTGIKGRTGVFEVIETDSKFMRLFETQGKFAAFDYWRKNKKGVTLTENAIRLINEGTIDPVITHKSICNLDRDDKFYEQD